MNINPILFSKEIKAADGDFWKDGVLYCGKCKTAKSAKITLLGNEVQTACLCKCETEKRDKLEAERKQAQKEQFLVNKKILAFGEKCPIWEYTFSADDGKNQEVLHLIKKYAENFKRFFESGRGLLLYGNVGSGKTFYAGCVANHIMEHGYTVKFTSISQIANEMYTDKKAEFMSDLQACSLLVIDDLGVERNSQYMNEIIYNVIDGRYRAGKPLIVTTNITADRLKNPQTQEEQRIFSRIKERCLPVKIVGEDKRIEKAKQSMADDMAFLKG